MLFKRLSAPPGVGAQAGPIRAFVFHDPPSPCILGTHHEKGAQTFWSVVNRLPLSSNAVLCWKFCHVFHKLLRDGHPNVSACGCGGWAGSLGPTWGKRSCLSHRGHCPLWHCGWQLPPSPGLLGTSLRDGFISHVPFSAPPQARLSPASLLSLSSLSRFSRTL